MNKEHTFINQDNINIQIIFNDVGLLNLITVKNIDHDETYYFDATKIFKKFIKINPKMTWSKTMLILYSFDIIEKQINCKFEDNIQSLINLYGMKTHLNSRLDSLLK